MPSTNILFMHRNRMSIGSIASIVPAIMRLYWLAPAPPEDCSFTTATTRVVAA